MRQLTGQEREALNRLQFELTDGLDGGEFTKQMVRSAARAAFVAGLDYQQAKIDTLLEACDNLIEDAAIRAGAYLYADLNPIRAAVARVEDKGGTNARTI